MNNKLSQLFITSVVSFIILLLWELWGIAETAKKDMLDSHVLATSNVNKTEITIGEEVRYTIRVEYNAGVEVSFPEFNEKLANFTIEDYGRSEPIRLDNGRFAQEEWYLLDTFLTGHYVIPPARIRYKAHDKGEKTIETSEIFVEVKSVIKEGEEINDIREIIGPIDIPISYTRVYLIIGGTAGLLAILAGMLFIIRKRKAEIKRPEPPPLLAHEAAYKELKDLIELDLVSKGMIKEYYYRLSHIVRLYIEKRFDVMAPERTTEEFLIEMTRVDRLEREHKQLIRKFLEHCDLVKFARYGPGKDEIDMAYNAAKMVIDETKLNGVVEGREKES